MKNLFYAVILLGSLTFSGCALNKMMKAAEDQSVTVTPNPLELHGDNVTFTIDYQLPAKMLKEGIVYSVKPYYVYGDKEITTLEPYNFIKSDFPNSDTEPISASKEYSFAYEEDMRTNGALLVQGTATIEKNDKSKSTERKQVATGIITTSQMVTPSYYAAYLDHGYNNQEELVPVQAAFYFLQGRSQLRTSELRSERGQKFNAFIADKNVTRSVTITGTHSPEGPERINENLAEDRAQAIEDYYRRQMNRYDYKGMADSIEFILKPVVEDWTMFKKMLALYDGITEDQKKEYYEIVNGPATFEEKEDRLHKLPTYNEIFKEIYPELRVAKTEVLTVKEKKTDAEIVVLAKEIVDNSSSADTLTMEELLYAASLTPSLDERVAIYVAATKKDEQSAIAHNNLAAVHLELAREAEGATMTGLVQGAITHIEISLKQEESAAAYVNLAVANAMLGNYEKAYEAASKASEMELSSENERGLMGVKGALEIMTGDYQQATTSLNNATDSDINMYNKGLAILLKGEYANAANVLEELAGKTSGAGIHANAHYLAAVANARLGKDAEAFSNLEAAVDADAELREKALSDLVFANYLANEEFRDALK